MLLQSYTEGIDCTIALKGGGKVTMAASDDIKGAVAATSTTTGEASDVITQENVSPRGQTVRSSSNSKNQVRHRASVACASCRDRRIRCVVPQGQSECNQCRRAGTECVIKNDDERRR